MYLENVCTKCTVWGEIRYSAQAQRLEGSEGGAALFEYIILLPKIKFPKHLNILASLYLSLVPLKHKHIAD
jgi:hypothetical protein